ncbi:MAG: radical SAM protein [Chloroflexi bacterium]|nr:radical SAM protein [Chloroflexota bacterium]
MIVEITPSVLSTIKNPKFRSYADIYRNVYERFLETVRASGLEIDSKDEREENLVRRARMARKGAIVRNDDKRVYVGRLSPSCAACQTGLGTATFFISLKCHRNCFYCFNPNQEDYEYYSARTRDCLRELDQIHASGARLDHIGLTGGEPLLHKAETIEFFRFADSRFPDATTRLYTSGDHIEAETLQALQRAHLDEIRFSIRLHDSETARRHTFDQIALAKAYVPNVMVEMPVVPGALEEMKQVLLELDRLQVFGINLLEFCFPLTNADAFREKGYRIKNRPYRVLYNYGYAGGLPVAGSEADCLELVEFAIDAGLPLGVHYCSLENKHTGEIYQRHFERPIAERMYFSPTDYFLKSAKVFGKDIPKALQVFDAIGYKGYEVNREHHYLEFHVNQIQALKALEIEVGISTSVMEDRPDGEYLRELQIDLTTPQTFELASDL